MPLHWFLAAMKWTTYTTVVIQTCTCCAVSQQGKQYDHGLLIPGYYTSCSADTIVKGAHLKIVLPAAQCLLCKNTLLRFWHLLYDIVSLIRTHERMHEWQLEGKLTIQGTGRGTEDQKFQAWNQDFNIVYAIHGKESVECYPLSHKGFYLKPKQEPSGFPFT